MKLLIVCDERFHDRISVIETLLESHEHEVVVLPNCYVKTTIQHFSSDEECAEFTEKKFEKRETIIKGIDGVLLLNFDEKGQKNNINAETLLVLYDAFRFKKDIYLWKRMSKDRISNIVTSFSPIVINGNIAEIPMINKVQKDILTYLARFKDKKSMYNGLVGVIAERTFKDKKKEKELICQTEINSLLDKEMIDKKTKEQIGTKMDYYIINDKGLEYLENDKVKHKNKVKSLEAYI